MSKSSKLLVTFTKFGRFSNFGKVTITNFINFGHATNLFNQENKSTVFL